MFEIAATIKKPNPLMMMSLSGLLGGMFGQQHHGTLNVEHRKKLTELLIDWYPQLRKVPQIGPFAFMQVVSVLRGNPTPESYFSFLDDEVARWRSDGKKQAGPMSLAAMMGRGSNKLAIAPMTFPPEALSDFPPDVLSLLRQGDNNPFAAMMAMQGNADGDDWNAEQVHASLKKVKDPVLRLLLAHRHEDKKLADRTLGELLAAKPPLLDAYLLGAGMAGMDSHHADAVESLEKAHYMCQVWFKKMNESEQSMTCRKAIELTSKPGSVVDLGQIQIVPVYRLGGVRCRGCMILNQAHLWNVGTCWFNAKGRGVTLPRNSASTNVNQRGGATRSSDEAAVMAVEQRGCVIQSKYIVNQQWEEQ